MAILKLFQVTAATAALVSSVNGLVVPQGQGAAFSVDAIAPSAPEQFDPSAELRRLWAKFPTLEDPSIIEARSDGQHGAIPVNPQSGNISYFVPTVIGNQTFNLVFDTGSADLWVYSNESSPWQSLDHPTYVPTSSAELLPNYTWAIKYSGGQSVSGVVYTDTVKAGPLVAHKQAVEAATVIPFEFASDGILGLASGSINTVQPVKQKTFFETLMPTLQRKLFAANLRIDGKPSTWDFGYIDESKFRGPITYTPVVGDYKHWTIAVGSYATGQGPFSSSDKQIGNVILDSGSALIYLPDAVVNDYYSHVDGYELQEGGSHTFPCNSTIPDLRFKVGDTILSVPGRDVNLGVNDAARGICSGSITTQLSMKYSVLGNIFMRNYYVIHSKEEETPKIGFAGH